MNEEATKAICVILWSIGGAIAFGGLLSLCQGENKEKEGLGDVFDVLLLAGFFTALSNLFTNWKKKKESTWLFTLGMSMAFLGGIIWLLR